MTFLLKSGLKVSSSSGTRGGQKRQELARAGGSTNVCQNAMNDHSHETRVTCDLPRLNDRWATKPKWKTNILEADPRGEKRTQANRPSHSAWRQQHTPPTPPPRPSTIIQMKSASSFQFVLYNSVWLQIFCLWYVEMHSGCFFCGGWGGGRGSATGLYLKKTHCTLKIEGFQRLIKAPVSDMWLKWFFLQVCHRSAGICSKFKGLIIPDSVSACLRWCLNHMVNYVHEGVILAPDFMLKSRKL